MNTPANATPTAVQSAQVSAAPCRLLYLSVTNNAGAPRYLMGWDATALPPDGATTGLFGHEAVIGAGATRVIDVSHHGIACDRGLVVCLSTTPVLKKLSGGNDLTLNAYTAAQ